MSGNNKWNTPTRYLRKRAIKANYYWKVGGGKNGKYSFKYIRRSKLFKSLDVMKLSMLKLWKRKLIFWD